MSGQVQVSVQRHSLIHNESLMHNYSKIDTNDLNMGAEVLLMEKNETKLTHSLTGCADHQIINSIEVRNLV